MDTEKKKEGSGHIRDKLTPGPITKDTPLTLLEQKFINAYMKCGVGTQALKAAGIQLNSDSAYSDMARSILNQPNVQAEIEAVVDEIKKDTIASTSEVMAYFTAVMRGEIKDQFGLDASLMERTRAAQELAKRTVDIENRKKGEPDKTLSIKLDWSRNDD